MSFFFAVFFCVGVRILYVLYCAGDAHEFNVGVYFVFHDKAAVGCLVDLPVMMLGHPPEF